MRDQSPKLSASAKSILREHSAYCEATGPVAQEGFVAAQVRAIQGSYNGTQRKMSHLPMTLCPIAQRPQVLDDQMPVIQDLTLRTSEPEITTKKLQHQHHHQHLEHHPKPAEVLCEHGPGSENGDTSTPAAGDLPKFREQHGVDIRDAVEEPRREDSARAAVPTPGANVNSASPSELYSSPTTPSKFRHEPTKKLSTALMNDSTPISIRDKLKTPLPPDRTEGVSKEDIAETTSQEHSLVTESHSFRVQTPPSLQPIDELSEDSPRSVHYESAGRGRGIKRVQVIVSLDGTADLIVEAKLLGRPGQVDTTISNEPMGGMGDWQLDDRSDQSLF